MERLARQIVFSGLALVTLGLAVGLVFTYLVDHEARLVAYDAYDSTLELILAGMPETEWRPELEQTSSHSMTHRHASRLHTHAVNMGIVLILMGLFAPVLGREADRNSRWLAWGLVIFAWVYPAGLLLQLLGLSLAGQVVAAGGASLFIVALILLFVRVSRALVALRA